MGKPSAARGLLAPPWRRRFEVRRVTGCGWRDASAIGELARRALSCQRAYARWMETRSQYACRTDCRRGFHNSFGLRQITAEVKARGCRPASHA